MNILEFNEKWKSYLEEKHYGLIIVNDKVVDYLDKEFEKEICVNRNFSYSQIKLKFGQARVYADTKKAAEWERRINEIVYNKGKIKCIIKK